VEPEDILGRAKKRICEKIEKATVADFFFPTTVATEAKEVLLFLKLEHLRIILFYIYIFIFYVFIYLFSETGSPCLALNSLCNLDWAQTHNPPASAAQLL
jgi:hypothetical protein